MRALTPDFTHIKRLALIGMISDDDLMERLVLKGGSALQLVYDLTNRVSFDLDFSMADGLTEEEFPEVSRQVERALQLTFNEADYTIFDFTFKPRPSKVNSGVSDFWGGYAVDFKIMETGHYGSLQDIEQRRREALVLGENGSTKFSIDISSYEYCAAADSTELDGYQLLVYTPEMIVCEKARAICQQLPAYREIVISHTSRPRARDFYDIHLLHEQFNIDTSTPGFRELLAAIFAAKRVPLQFLELVPSQRQLHRNNFEQSLLGTLTSDEEASSFDTYFDFFVRTFFPLAQDQKEG